MHFPHSVWQTLSFLLQGKFTEWGQLRRQDIKTHRQKHMCACSDGNCNITQRVNCLDSSPFLFELDMCVFVWRWGPPREAGKHLAVQTCCHQQIVGWREQWGWISVLSVNYCSVQSSRNVFLLCKLQKEVKNGYGRIQLGLLALVFLFLLLVFVCLFTHFWLSVWPGHW